MSDWKKNLLALRENLNTGGTANDDMPVEEMTAPTLGSPSKAAPAPQADKTENTMTKSNKGSGIEKVFEVFIWRQLVSILVSFLLDPSLFNFDYRSSRGTDRIRFWIENEEAVIGRRNDQGEFSVRLTHAEGQAIAAGLDAGGPGMEQQIGKLRLKGFEDGVLLTKTVKGRGPKSKPKTQPKPAEAPRAKVVEEKVKTESAPSGPVNIEDVMKDVAREAAKPRPRAQFDQKDRLRWLQTVVRFTRPEIDPKGHTLGIPFDKSLIEGGAVEEIEDEAFGLIVTAGWDEEKFEAKMAKVYSGDHPMASAMGLKDQYDEDRKVRIYWHGERSGPQGILARKVGGQYFLLPLTCDQVFGGHVLDGNRLDKTFDYLSRNGQVLDPESDKRPARLEQNVQANLWKNWLKGGRKGCFKSREPGMSTDEFRAMVQSKAEDKCRIEFEHGCKGPSELILELEGIAIACCKRAAVGFRTGVEEWSRERLSKASKKGDWSEVIVGELCYDDLVGPWPLDLCGNRKDWQQERGDTFLRLPFVEHCGLTRSHQRVEYLLVSLERRSVEDTVVRPLSAFAGDELVNWRLIRVGLPTTVGEQKLILLKQGVPVNGMNVKTFLRGALGLEGDLVEEEQTTSGSGSSARERANRKAIKADADRKLRESMKGSARSAPPKHGAGKKKGKNKK